jgi:hypothetical protein
MTAWKEFGDLAGRFLFFWLEIPSCRTDIELCNRLSSLQMILAGGHGEGFSNAVSDDIDSNRAVIRFDVYTCHMLHHTSFIARGLHPRGLEF